MQGGKYCRYKYIYIFVECLVYNVFRGFVYYVVEDIFVSCLEIIVVIRVVVIVKLSKFEFKIESQREKNFLVYSLSIVCMYLWKELLFLFLQMLQILVYYLS